VLRTAHHHLPKRLRRWIAVGIRAIRGREPIMLVVLLLIALGTWGFIELTDEVLEGSTGVFDRWAVRQLRQEHDPAQPIGPTWLKEVGRDVTAMGGISILSFFVAATAGFLAVQRANRTMVVLLASTISGIVASLLLKRVFDRPRPDLVPHLSEVYTSSFPSGHSMMSALVYLTLGALVAPVLAHFWLRVYVIALAIFLTGCVGISRIYMGVHYPTDVLAGWAAGSVWALLCWLLARWLTIGRANK